MDRLLFLILLSATQSTFCNAKYVFALIPKSLDNSFFDASKAGCEDNAQLLGVSCWFTAPLAEDASAQEELVESLLGNETISGVAISVTRAETMTAVINKLVQAGMPVVTFDSDAPDSKRLQYIGTDNFFFGQRLATILIQLKPYGGTFALLGTSSTNIQERIHGFKHKLREHSEDPIWTEIKGSPADFEVNVTLAMEQLQMFANQNPTAIIPMMGTPMNSGAWIEFVLENEARNITLLCGDAMPLQLEYLERGYVDGLLGQLPYEMGFAAIANLKKLVEGKGNDLKTIQGTNVLAHVKIPLVLPPLEVNENLLGGYVVVGLILFAIVTACSIGFIAWTMNYRKLYIVQASQPMFLIMVAVGTLILASTIVPMSFDDQGDENSCKNSDSKCVAICMSVPWLGCIGFTTAFGALYSKTARINKIFHQKEVYARVKVTERDVLLPYCIHMTANIM
jgi:ABC-type sugar transport system substrate-binding protein